MMSEENTMEQQRVFVAKASDGTQAKIKPKRPKWDDVYNGYPKLDSGKSTERDMPAIDVFPKLLGDDYDKKIFSNACATRISLGLISGGMIVKTAYKITNKQHPFYKKGFLTSALGLKNWLSEKNIWGKADVLIKGKTYLEIVTDKINNGGVKNGIYIILGGFGDGVTGHATLWIGKNKNVLGGHNYIDYGGDVYFWELK